jgi:cell wall-associated NlpC family hydrolase
MDEIICLLPLVPLRREPNHRSEMVSQFLFGEKAKVLNHSREWIEIETRFDAYRGWIEINSVSQFTNPSSFCEWIVTPKLFTHVKKANCSFFIPSGSEIPLPDESNQFELNAETYKIATGFKKSSATPITTILEIANEFMNAPYLWGGKCVFGIDCSGLTQILYKNAGIPLPRDAKDQAQKGLHIESLKNSLPGDLLFFGNDSGTITHVGVLISDNKILHASVCVRVDTIDEHGIYNEKLATYTHKLAMIKRLLH